MQLKPKRFSLPNRKSSLHKIFRNEFKIYKTIINDYEFVLNEDFKYDIEYN